MFRTLLPLLLFALFLLPAASSDAATRKSLTAAVVLEHIEKVGPKKALQEYYDSGEFNQILNGIGTADSKWLDVYTRLYPIADAGAAEDLATAIMDVALPRAPFKVIAIVKAEGWSIEDICTFTFHVECPPDGIWPYLDRLEHALRKANNLSPWETSVRDGCMKGIRTARIQFPKEHAINYCRLGSDDPAFPYVKQ